MNNPHNAWYRPMPLSYTEAGLMQHCGNAIPMVVMIVPEKKKALARSQLLLNVALFFGSTPAPMASVTFCGGIKNNSLDGWYV